MTRANLDDVPAFALPDGFSWRWHQPGDEAHWRRIHLGTERFLEIAPGLFGKQFGNDANLLHERQCYLLAPRGEIIGTGTAWFDDDAEGAHWGRVHWMAILPEFQGRGLGRTLMTTICLRLRALGHERVFLHTSAARIPALKLYLKFGFEPMIRSQEEQAIWKEVLAGLRRVS